MSSDRGTLGEMSHTNPYTGDVFGDTQTFTRGRTIAADGGERDAASIPVEDNAAVDVDEQTLEDVDHEPPAGGEGAQRAYERGTR